MYDFDSSMLSGSTIAMGTLHLTPSTLGPGQAANLGANKLGLHICVGHELVGFYLCNLLKESFAATNWSVFVSDHLTFLSLVFSKFSLNAFSIVEAAATMFPSSLRMIWA